MLIAWLYLFLREAFGDRFRDYLEPMLNRQHERLQKRICRLQVSSAKLDAMSTLHQHKSPYSRNKRQSKMDRKVEKLSRKSAKLEEIMDLEKDSSEEHPQPEEEFAGKWIKESDNGITILPPAYDDICPQQPPSYDEVQKDNLYPILT